MIKRIKPYILSGGSGTRLWPLSRSLHPKQFININNKNSFFQNTLLRLKDPLYSESNIICNQEHRFFVSNQSKKLNIKTGEIILEPLGKNTAASAIIAALTSGYNDLILLLPSDHVVKNKKYFNNSIQKAVKAAENDKIVLFGIKPKTPETDYGYITIKKEKTFSSYMIDKFIEKPNLLKAKRLIKSNSVFWNSGIFLFKASTLLKESEKYCPAILNHVKKALKNSNTKNDYVYMNEKNFIKIKSISIDYAIIQKSKNLVMNKLNTPWSDMGTWQSYWTHNKKDKNNNFIEGRNFNDECYGNLIISDKQFTLTSGLKDFIVVSLSNSLLVLPKSKLSNLSNFIKNLSKKNIEETRNSLKYYRPWGTYEILKTSKNFQVKQLTINPKSAISLQKHKKRSEHWVVIEGTASVTLGRKNFELHANQSVDIDIDELHRLENNTDKIVKIIEIQSGTYLGEDDIIRYEDKYKRENDKL